MQNKKGLLQHIASMRVGQTYEYDRWGIGACSLKEVPDASGCHALEHLHKLSSIGTVEGDASFTCHGLGQVGLASSRGPFKHDTLHIMRHSGHCWFDYMMLHCMGVVLQCMDVVLQCMGVVLHCMGVVLQCLGAVMQCLGAECSLQPEEI